MHACPDFVASSMNNLEILHTHNIGTERPGKKIGVCDLTCYVRPHLVFSDSDRRAHS